jgi:hypothetical protein
MWRAVLCVLGSGETAEQGLMLALQELYLEAEMKGNGWTTMWPGWSSGVARDHLHLPCQSSYEISNSQPCPPGICIYNKTESFLWSQKCSSRWFEELGPGSLIWFERNTRSVARSAEELDWWLTGIIPQCVVLLRSLGCVGWLKGASEKWQGWEEDAGAAW